MTSAAGSRKACTPNAPAGGSDALEAALQPADDGGGAEVGDGAELGEQLRAGGRAAQSAGAAHAARTAGKRRVQRVEVEGGLFVGVHGAERADDGADRAARQDQLEAGLVGVLELEFPADRRVGRLVAAEGAAAGELVAALGVVADHAGADGGERPAQVGDLGGRDEDDQLVVAGLVDVRLERPALDEVEGVEEDVVGAADRDVERGVQGDDRDARGEQVGQQPRRRVGVGGDPADALEDRRVVDDQRVDLLAEGLAGDVVGQVDREQELADGVVAPAGEQADVVPVGGPRERGEPVERGDEVPDGRGAWRGGRQASASASWSMSSP
jgi:hypothetical protein